MSCLTDLVRATWTADGMACRAPQASGYRTRAMVSKVCSVTGI
jgi:hypothetical protein